MKKTCFSCHNFVQNLNSFCERKMLAVHRASGTQLRLLQSRVVLAYRAYSKDNDSSSDDEKEKKPSKQPKPAKSAAAVPLEGPEDGKLVSRLNRLLATMQTDTNYNLTKQAISMARPGEANKKRREAAKEATKSKDIFVAAKEVAAHLGSAQAESELLTKLLGRETAASAVARDAEKPASQESEMSLSDLIVGMKIDRRQQPREQTRSEFVRRTLAQRNPRERAGSERSPRAEFKRTAESYTGSVDLFGSEPLGIFKEPTQLRAHPDLLQTWGHLQRQELQLLVKHPPANYFEKVALWTEQGKVWQFPINNEQGMVEEENVDFSEHIFLEQHLEPWCPTKGPIRHFMELVCVGLSKNPYITAQEKKDHILWYRDYFESKKHILKELMGRDKITQGQALNG